MDREENQDGDGKERKQKPDRELEERKELSRQVSLSRLLTRRELCTYHKRI